MRWTLVTPRALSRRRRAAKPKIRRPKSRFGLPVVVTEAVHEEGGERFLKGTRVLDRGGPLRLHWTFLSNWDGRAIKVVTRIQITLVLTL